MTKRFFLLLALVPIGGCASAVVFDESANGQTVEVEQGRVFSISLSGSSWTLAAPGAVVASTARSRDESASRDIFQFKAEAVGEVELRFSRPAASEYVLRVKVQAPTQYHMKPHTG